MAKKQNIKKVTTKKQQVKAVKAPVKKVATKKSIAKKTPVCKCGPKCQCGPKCNCVKPVKVSLNDIKVTTKPTKKSFWTKVKEFFGF